MTGSLGRLFATDMGPAGASVERWAIALDTLLWRGRGALLVVFTLLHFVFAFADSAGKPLWFDELITYYIARAESSAAVIGVLKSGSEPHPPLGYLLSHVSLGMWADTALGLRFPSMVAFWAMALCMFAIVRRRCSTLVALNAVLIIYVSGAWYYAYEARPYAIVLCLAALAFLAWQRATERRDRRLWWLILLSGALAGAFSAHYHAVFLPVVIGFGELAATFQKRRVDWPVWCAIAGGYGALAWLYPFIASIRANVAASRIGAPYWLTYVSAYNELFSPLVIYMLPAVALTALLLHGFRDTVTSRSESDASLPELVAAAAYLMLPILVLAFAMAIGSIYAARYGLAAVIGAAILIVAIVNRTSALVALMLAFCLAAGFVTAEVRSVKRVYRSGAVQQKDVFPIPLEVELPVVVQDPRVYLQLFHYAAPEVKKNIWYVAEPEESLRRLGTDLLDRSLLNLRKIAPVNVERYDTFVRTNPTFFLYWDGTPGNLVLTGVLLPLVSKRGADIRIERQNGARLLYRVSIPRAGTRAVYPPPLRRRST
jgi:hypothetical protein